MEKRKISAIEIIVRRVIREEYSTIIRSGVKKETSQIIERFKNQISILQSNNRNLLKHQSEINDKHNAFMKAMPEAFEYLYTTYGSNGNISAQTRSKMAIDIIKFKLL